MSNVSRLFRRRIGEILLNQGVITGEQLEEALTIQKRTGELLGIILQDLGLISEGDVAKIICIQYQLPFMTLANYELDNKLLKLFPLEFLTKNKILPFDKIGDTLLLMVAEIPPDNVLADIPKLTKLNAALYVGYASEVDKYLSGNLVQIKASGAKLEAGGPAHGAGEPLKKRAVIGRTMGEDDEDADESVLAPADDEGQGQTLVFGATSKAFLEELNSTWDQIFPGSGSGEDKGSED